MSSFGLSVGIVGLPNVGKSTLFNALLQKQQALAANYPFATLEPNVGIVQVPDERLGKLAEVIGKGAVPALKTGQENSAPAKLPPLVPATIEFVDIAGLVKGASQGEGLGNQFLANIREVDLICHVLRSFEDPDVILTGKLDPLEDLQTIRLELCIKDLETVEKQDKRIKKEGSKIGESTRTKALELLQNGQMLNQGTWSDEELAWLKELSPLTLKPEIYVVNVSEAQLTNGLDKNFHQKINTQEENVVYISAKIESELSDLPQEEKQLYLNELGLETSGIERMAQVAYQRLNLISFLTAGEKECRAWTVKRGTNAQVASGVIHHDFINKFIKAKVCAFNDFIQYQGWTRAAEAGKVRNEGRDYQIKDGDVVEFMIGK
jgi:GTP-binding protein YchF